jgi:hypothetical protein
MKGRISKDFLLFILLIPLFLWGAFYISRGVDEEQPYYLISNKSRNGCSVFFEALKEIKLPVERGVSKVSSYDYGDMQIVTQARGFDVNSEEIKSWVEKGGTLVYLVPNNIANIQYGVFPKISGITAVYNYNKGRIITSNIFFITNKALSENTHNAYSLLQEINSHSYNRIFFNEAHLLAPIDKKTLWDTIPLEYKHILYQIFIVLTAFFYYKGKRFGKPSVLHEEVERTENENVYAQGALYSAADCWDLAAESYYNDLLRKFKSSNEKWLEQWEKEELPELERAKRVYSFMNRAKEKVRAKEYKEMITLIDYLTGIIYKRRDSYWKVLKKEE